MNQFSHSPKLVRYREFEPKPELLRENYGIGDQELLQTTCKDVFINFRQAGEK